MKYIFSSLRSFRQQLSLPFLFLGLVSICASVYLTVIGIKNNLFFSYDQARDALESYSIWHEHHVKILGPATDINGVFHGVLWYYVLAIFYAIHNQPEFVAICLSILLFISAGVVAFLSQKLFKNTLLTLIAFMLYIMSPLFLMSTHWLSNPVLSFIIVPFLLFFLWQYIEKPKALTLFIVGIILGILIQGEFAYAMMLLCFPLYWYFFKIPVRIKDIFCFFIGLLLVLISFFIAELKFHFQGVIGMVNFLHQSGHGHLSVQLILVNLLQRTGNLFATSSFAFPSVVVIFLLGVCCFFLIQALSEKQKKPLLFLLIWLGGLFFYQFFNSGISTSYFLFYPFLPSAIILTAFLLTQFLKNKFILFFILCLLIFSQVQLSRSYLANNFLLFTVQQGATLPEEKEIVTYTYASANGMPFTINAVTNPLYINTTWAYLYTHYGLTQYGYLPYWGGRGEGSTDLFVEKQFATPIRFLIFEPQEGIPDIFNAKITYEEDKISDIVEEKRFGKFIVQKRILHLKKIPPIPPVILQHSVILYE